MSGGRITLAIYIAIGFIPVVFGPAPKTAEIAQSSVHVRSPVPDRGWAPWVPIITDPTPPGHKPETVVIRFGNGGRMADHHERFTDYRATKTKVEIRGPCYSACTLVLAYVPAEDICIAQGAFLAFHAVRSGLTGERMDRYTQDAYNSMPPTVRAWIDYNGGYEKLPVNGYWTMYDRQMWAMGYPRCK